MIWHIAPMEPGPFNAWAYLTPTDHGDAAFTEDECDLWLELAQARAHRPGMVGPLGELQRDIRDVEVIDVDLDAESSPLYGKLSALAISVNAAWWGFELAQLRNVEVLRYEPGGHYVPHVDWSQGNQLRKVSIVVMLSDADEYSGGDLMIHASNTPMPAPRERGSVILFPAWTLHGVTPVTEGERRTATAWIEGPRFR